MHIIKHINSISKLLITNIVFYIIIACSYTNAWNYKLNVEDECVNDNCFSYNVSGDTYVIIPSDEIDGVSISWGDEPGSETEKKRHYEAISGCVDSIINQTNYKKCTKEYNDHESIHKVIIKDVEEVKKLYLENANIVKIRNTFGLKGLEELHMKGNLLTDESLYPGGTYGSNFKYIDLSHNKLTAFSTFGYSSGAYIDLSNNQFTDIPETIRAYHNSSIIELSENTIYTGNNPTYIVNLKNNPINIIKNIEAKINDETGKIKYTRDSYSYAGYQKSFGYALTISAISNKNGNSEGNIKINKDYTGLGEFYITGTKRNDELKENIETLIITGTVESTGTKEDFPYTDLFTGYGIGSLDFSVYYIENPEISDIYNFSDNFKGGYPISIESPQNNEYLTGNNVTFDWTWTGYIESGNYEFCYTLTDNKHSPYSGCEKYNSTGFTINDLENGDYSFEMRVKYKSNNRTGFNNSVFFSINNGQTQTQPTEDTHTLTINYINTGNQQIYQTYIGSFSSGESYNITSPAVTGYTPNKTSVAGTMGNSNITETVTYSIIQSQTTGNTQNTHLLTIRYLDTNGNIVFNSDTHNLPEGTQYSYPTITKDNCTTSPRTVIGTMGSSDITETVYYTCSSSSGGGTSGGGSSSLSSSSSSSKSSSSSSKSSSSSTTKNGESNLTASSTKSQLSKGDSLNLTINSNNYVGIVKLYAKYQDGSGNRIKINNTDGNYFSDYSNLREMGYYNMVSSDRGKKTLNNLVEFKKEGIYRIYIEDNSGYLNYTTVYVGNQAQIQAQTQTQAQAQSQTQEHGSADIETILEELLGGNIYTTRSCKQYKIEYDSDLEAFTSPDMKKSEYFISIDYLKRYLDSKNPQKQDCPKNSGWISYPYKDNSNSAKRFTAPNGKVYSISSQNGKYYSNSMTSNKNFASLIELKYFIRDHNPLIQM